MINVKEFPKGYEGCDSPYDLGWKHGTEDIGSGFRYRPGISLNRDDMDEYKDGYREAQRGWY